MNDLGRSTLSFWRRAGAFTLVAAGLFQAEDMSAMPPPSRTFEARRPVFAAAAPTSPARFEYLEAGSRFDARRPPKGWNRLILKSTPRLASGDLDTISDEGIKTAGRIRLAIAAQVAPPTDSSGRYALDRIGVGLAAEAGDGDGDVVVTARSVAGSKGPWTTKERIVLAAGAYELSKASLTAATSSFALMRTPTTYLRGGEHLKTNLIYAFLVDPASGRLRTLVWLEDSEQAPQVVNELKTPATIDGALDVQASTIAGIPIAWSFAMTSIPGEIAHPVAPELTRRLASARLDATPPDALEATLLAVVAPPVTPPAKAKAKLETRTTLPAYPGTPAP